MKLRHVLLIALAAGCGGRTDLGRGRRPAPDAGTPAQPQCLVTASAPVVLSTEDLGELPHPATLTSVGGGQTTRLGSSVLWTFAEGILSAPAADGDTWRASLGAQSPSADPLALVFPLDAAGAPRELIALDQSERAFNAAHGPDETLVLWPMGAVTAADGAALVYYEKLDVKPGFLDFVPVSSGVARVAPGEVVATRDPQPLFVAPEPQFAPGATVFEGQVHLYACTGGYAPQDGCRVARAPLAHARERPAYTFWDGAGWSGDVAAAVVVFDWVPGGASVVWHPHLGKFVATYTEPFGSRLMVRTAPRPEGPWTEAAALLAQDGGAGQAYYGAEQAALAGDCGRDMVVTYYRGQASAAGAPRVLRVRLR